MRQYVVVLNELYVIAIVMKLINGTDDSDDDDASTYAGGAKNNIGVKGDLKGSNGVLKKKKRKKDLIAEIDQELLENAKEANRQRAFIERSAADLKHRLDLANLEMIRSSQRRLHENSHLVYECNELRAELKTLKRRLKIAIEEKDRLMVALANTMTAGDTKGKSTIPTVITKHANTDLESVHSTFKENMSHASRYVNAFLIRSL
jgi:hypothetical protein